MIGGISTACLYPKSTEFSLQWVADSGASAAEVFLNAPSELKRDYLEQLKAMATGRGCNILSLHPFSSAWEPMLLFSTYSRRNEDGIKIYRMYFDAANILGAKIVVIHGAFRDQNITPATYCRHFGRLRDIAAQEYGLTLAQENVVRFKAGDLDFVREMQRLLPGVRFVLDTKQAHRSGYDPLEVAKVMGKSICHVHISDAAPENDCLPIGQGQWDYRHFLRYLQEIGYTGGVIQEVYRDSYRKESQVVEGYRLLQNAIREVADIV